VSGAGGVRRAEGGDLDRVVGLWLALTEHHARLDPLFGLRAGAAAEARRVVEAQLRDPDVACFVHGQLGSPDGLCIVRIDRAPAIHAERQRAEITDLFVEPGRRRCGVGAALLEAALGWARSRGSDRVEVRVAATNRSGQAFWRAAGFGDFMDVLHRRL
jgi:GNAT superfamily N-acetyltransferase